MLPDNLFDPVLKYLSVLQDDSLVAFVPPVLGGGPEGFVCENSFQIQRSRGILSSGVGLVSFVVCAESGVSLPLIGHESGDKLCLSPGVGFDECVDFLSDNGYHNVDIVFSPGDYSIRGGLLDVFPFFSTFWVPNSSLRPSALPPKLRDFAYETLRWGPKTLKRPFLIARGLAEAI